jgi:hypothetical protein
MTELAAVKRILDHGWLVKCTIVKMHDQSWRTFSAPTVPDLRKPLEHLFAEVTPIEHFPSGSQLMKMTPWMLTKTSSVVLWASTVYLTLVGTSAADTHQIYRRVLYHRNHDSSPVTVSQKLTLSWLSSTWSNSPANTIRFSLLNRLAYRESNEVRNVSTNAFKLMRIDCWRRNAQGIRSHSHWRKRESSKKW